MSKLTGTQRLDITGLRFNFLTAICRGDKRKGGYVWHFRCDCGAETTALPYKVLKGRTQSCGCKMRELVAAKRTKHGGKRGGDAATLRLYRIWKGMRQRCLNKSALHYRHYGGRGITICQEWDDFEAFREWALNSGYSDDLTIDRVNNNDGYRPDNCRWADYSTQVRNRRPRSEWSLRA